VVAAALLALAPIVTRASGPALELRLEPIAREAVTNEDGAPGVRWDYALAARNRGPQPVLLVEDRRLVGGSPDARFALASPDSPRLEPGGVWRAARSIARFTALKQECRALQPEVAHTVAWRAADGTRGEETVREVFGWAQASPRSADPPAPLTVAADVVRTNEVPNPLAPGRIFERRYDIRVAAEEGVGVTIERVDVEGTMRFTHATSPNGPVRYPLCLRIEPGRPTHWQTWYAWAVQDTLLPLLVDARVRYAFSGWDDRGRAREGAVSMVLIEPRRPIPPPPGGAPPGPAR
jgi:hypothetical protein